MKTAFVITIALTATSIRAQTPPPPAMRQVAPLPPPSVTGQRILDLAREGKVQQAASLGRNYLKMHPATPRTGEHCAILVGFAYADLLLDRREESGAALGMFERNCNQRTFRDEFRLEAKRVRRVLNGESLEKVYPVAVVKPTAKPPAKPPATPSPTHGEDIAPAYSSWSIMG